MSPTEPIRNVSSLTYPRTGKRGVPQQFPRRLYEMLESEAKLASASPEETFVISWSESGRAFRILDVEIFASTILPRYFRTKKFSSFQRNLNLYGFTKVRRGPDTDMYAHPSFIRNQPDLLAQLRKSTSSSRRKLSKITLSDESDHSSSGDESPTIRTVSPSPSSTQPSACFQPLDLSRSDGTRETPQASCASQRWLTFNKPPIESHAFVAVPSGREGTGMLDLLALAVERAA